MITLDARNHGDSPHTNEMSTQLMSSDLIKFLNGNDIARCVLIGHSMGGRTAMLTALNFPRLIESLIVVDVSPVSSPGEMNYHTVYAKCSREKLSCLQWKMENLHVSMLIDLYCQSTRP